MIITAANIDKIPGVSTQAANRFAEHLHNAMVKYHITTPARICAFLAQLLEESGHLVYVAELWGPTPQQKKYEPPHQVAKDLGNTEFGDGRRYAGKGLIQITGRANYTKLSEDLGIDFVNVPRLLEQNEYAALSAGWFWNKRELNDVADLIDFSHPIDKDVNLEAFKSLTRRINGGTTHLQQRIDNYKAVAAVLYGNKKPAGQAGK